MYFAVTATAYHNLNKTGMFSKYYKETESASLKVK